MIIYNERLKKYFECTEWRKIVALHMTHEKGLKFQKVGDPGSRRELNFRSTLELCKMELLQLKKNLLKQLYTMVHQFYQFRGKSSSLTETLFLVINTSAVVTKSGSVFSSLQVQMAHVWTKECFCFFFK